MQKVMPKQRETGAQKPKIASGGKGKNGYVHVTKAGTVTEIRRTLGIKPYHIRNVRRAFKMAGVKY